MNRLVIDNIGPVSHIDIPINRLNVIIGKQSSGKSTIAKILSFCQWLEKDIVLHQETGYIDSDFLKKQLLGYHKIGNYLNEGAYIHYDGDYITFEFFDVNRFSISLAEHFSNSVKGKVAYIPAERNLVALANISSLSLERNYVRDYLFNWLSVRNKFSFDNAIHIAGLDVKYYFDEEHQRDRIILPNNKELEIEEASSGMQSIIPLYVYMVYVTKWIFEHDEETSYDKYSVLQRALIKAASSDASVSHLKERIGKSHYANLIIEEPELNLFPQTQVSLIYDMLRQIKFERDKLLLTTHSPYTLYAINNCMLSYIVKDSLDDDEKANVPSFTSRIDPEQVSLWEIKDDGTISDIKTSPLGLVGRHYFNQVMNDTLDEFHLMLDYTE